MDFVHAVLFLGKIFYNKRIKFGIFTIFKILWKRSEKMKSHKLVIVGVGHVGSYVLADAMKLGLFGEIGVIDINERLAYSEALDQMQARSITYMNNNQVSSGGYEQCADADIIIIAAGGSVIPDPNIPDDEPDRTLLTDVNSEVIRDIMGQIVEHTRDAIVICITNPADTITYIAENEFNYPQGKIFGTGTMLDSQRLRSLIAEVYDIDPKSVTGYMMGEHGVTTFPVLSHVNVAGIPFEELNNYFVPKVDISSPELVKNKIVTAAYQVMNGKGWTNAGVAQAAVTLARAIALNERSVYPVSTTLRGEYGYDGDVAFSMPCIIGKNGVEARLEVKLNDWELDMLHHSVEYIQAALQEAKAL